MSDIRRFQCDKCKRLFTIDFERQPTQKANLDKDGSFYQICGQTNKIEKCKAIK